MDTQVLGQEAAMNDRKKQQPTSSTVGPYQKNESKFSNHKTDKIS